MEGTLNLTIQCNQNNKSVMTDMSYTSPFKVLKPFYLDRMGTAYVYVMDVSGGMLPDDRSVFQVLVKQHAHLYLTSTSATKIHPMMDTDKYAKITTYFCVEENASLEYFPEELILFENAYINNKTLIELHSNSVFAFSEIIMMGRKHYGEMLNFINMKSNFEIKINGKIAIWDQFELSPIHYDVNDLGYMEQKSHYGNLYLYSNNHDEKLLECIRTVINESDRDIQVGCSLHISGVIVIKVLAHNHYSIKSVFKDIWKKVRPLTLKEALPYIRK